MNKKKLEFGNELRRLMQTTLITKVSISDLCKNLKCSRQSFYYYFDTVNDCLSYFLKESFKKEISDEYLISDIFNYLDRNGEFVDVCNQVDISRILFWDTLYTYSKRILDATLAKNISEYLSLYSEQRDAIVSFYASGILEEARAYVRTNRIPHKDRRIQYCKAMLGTSEDMKNTIMRFHP